MDPRPLILRDEAPGILAPEPVSIRGAASTDYVDSRIQEVSGWARYRDTQYTNANRFSVSSAGSVILPNNAGAKIETDLPVGLTSLYNASTGKILGEDGSSGILTVDLVLIPTSSSTTYVDMWLDLGGSLTNVFPQTVTFAKGNNQAHNVVYTVGFYVGSTWEANGARVMIQTPDSLAVHSIGYTVQVIHRRLD